MDSGRVYGKSPTGLCYSDDPDAYFKAYRRLPEEQKKARDRTKKRSSKLRKESPEFRAANAAYVREWRKRNPNYMAEYRKKNVGRLTEQQRLRNLRRYGLTSEDFNRMLAEQDGVCKICKGPPTGRWEKLFVDHDHKTGAVRGLLCHLCNSALERVDNYRDAIDRYLTGAER